jgi:isovaleryl-CoA dehydrogenase
MEINRQHFPNLDLPQFRERFRNIGINHCEDAINACKTITLPIKFFKSLAKEGLFSLITNQEFGRSKGTLLLADALENLAYGFLDGGIAISLISHIGLCISTIDRYASECVKEKYLKDLVSGEKIAAFAITELHGGSNALISQSELISKSDGSYILNGEKWHITNAPIASIIITFACLKGTNEFTALLVGAKSPGVKIQPLKPSGLRGSPVGSITFNNVTISKENILGQGVEGRKILQSAFLMERILSPFPMIGLVEHLTDKAVEYSVTRKVMGRSIGNHQHIQRRITDMKIGLETIRAIANIAINKFSEGDDVSLESSMAKMYAARILTDVATNAIQVYGSYGIQPETGFTQALLDGIAATIAGGTEEIHRSVIYGKMLRQYSRKIRCKKIINA